MKQKALRLTAGFLLAVLMLYVPAYAATPAIRSIDTTVELAEDGSAKITQVWDVTVTSGTEYYVPQQNLGKIKILDFTVTDETGRQYVNEGAWDVNRSIEQKAGRCGIAATAEGVELCWGVGSYGDHVFTISYTMTNMVKGFTDYDGFNVRFVNDQLSSPPQSIRVEISVPGVELQAEEVGVWAFGFTGEIYVQEGRVAAWSNEALSSYSYANIMVRLPKGLLEPTNVVDDSFSTMEEEAKRGSDYYPDKSGGYENQQPDYNYYPPNTSYSSGTNFLPFILFAAFLPILIIVVVVVLVITLGSGKKTAKYSPPPAEAIGYYRDIPVRGDLPMAYYLLKNCGQLSNENTIIGAWLLRWTRTGAVRMEETVKRGFFKDKKVASIQFFPNDKQFPDPCEGQLYKMLMKASGGDSILQEQELYNWAKNNYTKMESWTESVSAAGESRLRQAGALATVEERVFFNLISVKRQRLTPYGEELTRQLLGFKKYLLDFTIINERQPVEVQLWDDYLVFATLFDIADQVAEAFRAIYPRYFQDAEMNYMDYHMTMAMIHTMSRAGTQGAAAGHSAASSSSSGGGGFSSSGGGGGFSGGGSGGGSR